MLVDFRLQAAHIHADEWVSVLYSLGNQYVMLGRPPTFIFVCPIHTFPLKDIFFVSI